MKIPDQSNHKIMKNHLLTIIAACLILFTAACGGNKGGSTGNSSENSSVPDTGFTGIKQYMSGAHVAMETTFRNGIKEGLNTTYYPGGKIRGTTMFKNGLRVDSAKWFFETGELFRATPMKNDTVEGIQQQYYRNGRLKARIGYTKGLRTFEFEEFDMNGKKLSGYPELLVNTTDKYQASGSYTINLSMSDKAAKVRYYRGDFGNGLFDSARCEKINIVKGNGVLELKKAATPQPGYVDIVASVMSPFGNSYLIRKKIDLPYKDLK
jgi:hypothetical protein